MPNATTSQPGPMIATPVSITPTITDTLGVSDIENSELMKIANDALNAAKYAYVSAITNKDQPVNPDSLEAAFREGFKHMSAERQERVATKAKALVDLPEAARLQTFGRYGAMDATSFLAQGFQRAHMALDASAPLSFDSKLLGVRTPKLTIPAGTLTRTENGLLMPAAHIPTGFEEFEEDIVSAGRKAEDAEIYNLDQLSEIWGSVYMEDPMEAGEEDLDAFEPQAVTNKLGFYIRRIKCVDETNPEWWGHDEIGIAGVSVDETGDTKKISERYVGGGFDDGDTKWYSPHWRYHWFALWEGTKWPKGYSISLILAEKDCGGLENVLNRVWQRIKDYVKNFIERVITAGLAEYLGPILASWIGKIVAWVVDKLVGWIIRAFADDIFPPKIATVSIPGYYYRWPGGSTRSPYRYAHFYGHGGHYYVEYYWRLYS